MDARSRNMALLSAVERDDVGQFDEIVDGDDSLLRMSTPFGTWLHVAASAGQLHMVEYLIRRGLDLNAYGGTLGGGVLNAAASEGRTDVVKFLLSRGAELDVSEPERNPLFSAIYFGSGDIVHLLLKAGIDFSIKYSGESMKDMDAIAFAKERGRPELAEIIELWRS